MTRIELVHTDLIRADPSDPFNPCSIGGVSNCICFTQSRKSFNPSFQGSDSFTISINRTQMTRIKQVHTDLIRANPSDPFNPCSIGGVSNCICFRLSSKSYYPSFQGSDSFTISINRTQMTRIKQVHTDLIRANP